MLKMITAISGKKNWYVIAYYALTLMLSDRYRGLPLSAAPTFDKYFTTTPAVNPHLVNEIRQVNLGFVPRCNLRLTSTCLQSDTPME